MKIGLGFRKELATWILSRPARLECIEITAEHFFGRGEERLAALADSYAIYVHGLGLSLGTPGALDGERLRQFARVAEIARAAWVSEHVAFTRMGGADLGHLNPVPPTREFAALIADHAKQVADACGRPIILENITSHVQLRGDMTETEFLNEICAQADCGILLDVTNLFINARNHGFDPIEWLDELDCSRIRQFHLVGYATEGGRLMDSHGEPIQPEIIELARAIADRAPVRAAILERDANFGDLAGIESELDKLESLRKTDREHLHA